MKLQIPETVEANPFGDATYLPEYSDIPEEFKSFYNKYNKFVSKWFFEGIELSDLQAKDDINADNALVLISNCLRSWEPKHEHKVAGCAYMLSEWFDIKEK